jgi:hypothetical protein
MTPLERGIAEVNRQLDRCLTLNEALDWAAEQTGVSRRELASAWRRA